MDTQNVSVPHAYSPYCSCHRCYYVSIGVPPEDVDAYFNADIPAPVDILAKDNVIRVDFRARRRRDC